MIAGTSTGGILALGLGMGLQAKDILDFYERRGPWVKGKRIINLLMYAQEQGTIALTNSLATRARVLRVDQMLVPGTVSLDDVEGIPLLKDCGLRIGENRNTMADVKARFLNGINVGPWR